jgi:prolyl oligopeptidase
VKDIETGEMHSDHIKWVKFSDIACYNDGFFYSSYQQPEKGKELSTLNSGQKIFFHRFSTHQETDELVFSNAENPKRMYSASIDRQRRFLFISKTKSTSGNGLFINQFGNQGSKIIKLAYGFQYDYIPIDGINHNFLY